MDKVHCLKKLYTKVTGKEITDPNVDTICEVLHLLADDIDITNKEDITTEFATPILNTDKYSGTCSVGVLKSGATYQVNVNCNVTGVAAGSTLGKVATITFPEDIRSFSTRYEVAYCSMTRTGVVTYQVINVALVHTYGEATAELQILTDGLLAIDDNLIFGCQFIFIA